MKTISNNLRSHLAGEVTTIATCWRVVRSDGTVLGFTDHVDDLLIDAVTYGAATGISPSQLKSTAGMAVDNMEVVAFFDSESIQEVDIAAGLYDYAQVFVFICNYNDLTMGILKLASGRLGEVSYGQDSFVAEVRSLGQNLQQTIGEVYSTTCRADFGDARCGLSKATYTVTGALDSVADPANFTDSSRAEAGGFFNYGYFTFTSGANNGLSREVKNFAAGAFETFLPFPNAVAGTETYYVYQGCDKLHPTCRDTFSNVINFRGEPHIPGQDEIMKFGGQ